MAEVATPVVPLNTRRGRPYSDEVERVFRLAEITAIAHDHHWSIVEVANCYERILSDLKQHAQVQDFLYVFVAKKVAAELKKLHSH